MTSKNAEIAVLQEQMKSAREALSAFKAETEESFKSVNEKLDQNSVTIDERLKKIEGILTEAKGGWRMLVFIGGTAAALGAVLGKAVGWLMALPR